MTINKLFKIVFLLLFVSAGAVQAQRAPRHTHKPAKRAAVRQAHKARAIKRFKRSRVVVIKKRRGRVIGVLPQGAARLHFHKMDHHFHAGRYYRPHMGQYMMIIPPRGVRIKTLPSNVYRFTWKKRPHFYFAGVYYIRNEDSYETVDVEEGMLVPHLPEDLVEEVQIGEEAYYAVERVLYKRDGDAYKVIAELED